MERDYLVLKRASTSRPSGEWNDDDYDVLAVDVVVGRIMKAAAAPVDAPWLWTLAFRAPRGPHADARLRGDARGGDGSVRDELEAGVVQWKPKNEVEATSILPSLNGKTARS